MDNDQKHPPDLGLQLATEDWKHESTQTGSSGRTSEHLWIKRRKITKSKARHPSIWFLLHDAVLAFCAQSLVTLVKLASCWELLFGLPACLGNMRLHSCKERTYFERKIATTAFPYDKYNSRIAVLLLSPKWRLACVDQRGLLEPVA